MDDWDDWSERGNGDDGVTPCRPRLTCVSAHGTSYERGPA